MCPPQPKAKGSNFASVVKVQSGSLNPVFKALPDGTVLSANDEALLVRELFCESGKNSLAAELRDICAEVSGTDEMREVEIESGDRLFAFLIVPVANEASIKLYGRDVTERMLAEAQLAEKDTQLHLALERMPGGMLFFDRELNYVLFNSQYSKLHDFPDGLVKVGGTVLDEVRFQARRGDFGLGDQEKLIEQVLGRYRKGKAANWERTIASTGRTLQFHMAPTPEGGFVTIAHDITERKKVEMALVEAKQRSEESRILADEKNKMLESLSSKLSKYLSPQVYASIFSGKQSVEIASKRKKLTVFFSDIAEFTKTADSLESEDLTNLLNRYLTEMSKIALAYGATVDKYVGDAIIAFFGDPETRGVKGDAQACLNMAIEMQRRMEELRSEWAEMGLEQPFQIRIGINTGFCTVGNFGSQDRMDYTIIGNEVNLAARLQSHAETGGILIANETNSLVKDTVLTEESTSLTIKGFTNPVRTYKVIGSFREMENCGRVIRKEQRGLSLIVDQGKLTKENKASVIKALQDVLLQLKD